MSNNQYLCYVQNCKLTLKRTYDKLREKNWSEFIRQILRRILYPVGCVYPPMRLFLLKYRVYFHAGITHMSGDLSLLIKEAHYLNCTAVIPPCILPPEHNLGKKAETSVSNYYDLSASFLITEKGEKKPLDYILAEDFFRLRSDFFRLRCFPVEEIIYPQKTDKKTLIVRYHPLLEGLSLTRYLSDKPALYDFHNKTQLHLELAAPLKQVAEQITAKLGRYYVLRCRLHWDEHKRYSVDEMKRLIEKKRAISLPVLQHFFSGEGLCRQLSKVFPPGSNLFIASNLWKPYDEEYFGPLRRLYKVHRYYDFPELAEFVEGDDPNTARLFLVEQAIEQHSIDNILINYLRPTGEAGERLKKLVRLPSKQL